MLIRGDPRASSFKSAFTVTVQSSKLPGAAVCVFVLVRIGRLRGNHSQTTAAFPFRSVPASDLRSRRRFYSRLKPGAVSRKLNRRQW